MPLSSLPLGRRSPAMLIALVLLAPATLQHTPRALAQVSEQDDHGQKARLDALFSALAAAAGDSEAAVIVQDIWTTWSRSGRTDVDRLMDAAGASMEARNFGVASVLLDEVVSLLPNFAEGWNRRATLRFMMGDLEGSTRDIERTLALEPRHFGALSGRAMIHMKREQWQEALEAYRAALKANPFLPERHQVVPTLERKANEKRLKGPI